MRAQHRCAGRMRHDGTDPGAASLHRFTLPNPSPTAQVQHRCTVLVVFGSDGSGGQPPTEKGCSIAAQVLLAVLPQPPASRNGGDVRHLFRILASWGLGRRPEE